MRWYWGLAALAGGAALGAGIGALIKPEDLTGTPSAKWGAFGGGAVGVLLVGIAGVGATVSPDTRAAGLTAALPVAGVIAAGAIVHNLPGGSLLGS